MDLLGVYHRYAVAVRECLGHHFAYSDHSGIYSVKAMGGLG
jgi:hypothetical protein